MNEPLPDPMQARHLDVEKLWSIVRDLAAGPEPWREHRNVACSLCYGVLDGEPDPDDVEGHTPSCPWRRAVELVEWAELVVETMERKT